MKTNSLPKKLSLKKITVANLEEGELKKIKGGTYLSVKICTFATNSCVSDPCC